MAPMVSVINNQKGVIMSEERSSKWALIVYPDSAPTDWIQILKLSFVRFAVSPLHKPDPPSGGSGEVQPKPHYHVMLDFDSLKSQRQVEGLTHITNGTLPFIVQNPSGYFQYLIHLNDPEKEQFSEGFNAISLYNGFNAEKYEQFSDKQLDAIYRDIRNFIDDNNITEYSTLVDLIDNPEFDKTKYSKIIRTNTIYFNTYLCSRRNKLKKKEVNDFNKRLTELERLIKNE